MRTSAEYRRLAKSALLGKYGTMAGVGILRGVIEVGFIAALLVLVFITALTLAPMSDGGGMILIFIVLVLAVTVLLIGVVFVSMVFQGGVLRLARCACLGEELKTGDLFYGFKAGLAGRLIGLSILIGLIGLPFTLPYSLWNVFSGFARILAAGSPGKMMLTGVVGILLFLWYAAGLVIVRLFFGLSMYILIDRPELGAVGCMKESLRLTKGRKKELFFLWLGYAGYYILAVLSGGIGFLWVTPNIQCALYYFYWDLRAEKG